MNTIAELRKMAEEVLKAHPKTLNADEWSGNFKKLLEELSVYQIELEHQNNELARAERELAIAHNEFVKLFESTPVSYVILNEDRKIVRVNQTFINYFVDIKMKSTQIEGCSFDDYIVDEFHGTFVLFCKMALQQKFPVPIELKLRDFHGNPHYVLLNSKVYDAEKKLIAMSASDISVQKRVEAQLARAKDEAEDDDHKKSLFLTNVSHELRTPLSTIIGYGTLMCDPQISDVEKQDFCKSIVSSSKNLLSFVSDILDVSSLESGDMPLRNQIVDMDKLCAETVYILSRKFIDKNVLIKFTPSNAPLLWSDQIRLRQIIYSILEHAAGNITEGEINFSYTFTLENEKYGCLSLRFSGEDIFSAENDLTQYNNRAPMLRCYSSIWMFLIHRILKAMHGKIIWEHQLNCLRIEIQTCIPALLDGSEIYDSTGFEQPVKLVQTEIKKCLLVDDVAMNLKVLEMMMNRLGYKSSMAMSGEEAIELVKEEKFDLIMTDLWMPKMSGEELAINLRQNPELDNVPICAVTADIENSNNFDMSFFNYTIVKPVTKDKLQGALDFLNKNKKSNISINEK